MLPPPAIDPPLGLPRLDDEWMLTGLGVDNLRALRMPEPIALRRLLLIVGRNGAGKSTLARVFPLLRQSVGSHAREPLLWWDRDQVDFGSFADALRRGADEMTFSFEFMARDVPPWRVSSTLCGVEDGSRVARVRYEEETSTLSLSFDATGALEAVDGHFEVGGVSSNITSLGGRGHIRYEASGFFAISARWEPADIVLALAREGIPNVVAHEVIARSRWNTPDFATEFERGLTAELGRHAHLHGRVAAHPH